MTEQVSKNEEAERICGRRPHGNALFQPCELGYACPICGASDETTLYWSEYNCFIYCKNCNLDIPSCLCKKYPEPRLTDKPLSKRERVIENTKTFLQCMDDAKAKRRQIGLSEAKIDFFLHEGKAIPIKPVVVPIKFVAEGELRMHTAWYEPLHIYGIGMTAKEVVDDLRSDISRLYQHYYLGDRNNMVGNSHNIIAWFDEHLKENYKLKDSNGR